MKPGNWRFLRYQAICSAQISNKAYLEIKLSPVSHLAAELLGRKVQWNRQHLRGGRGRLGMG